MCVVFVVGGGGGSIIVDFHLQKVRAKQNKTKQETIKSESVPYSQQNVHHKKTSVHTSARAHHSAIKYRFYLRACINETKPNTSSILACK